MSNSNEITALDRIDKMVGNSATTQTQQNDLEMEDVLRAMANSSSIHKYEPEKYIDEKDDSNNTTIQHIVEVPQKRKYTRRKVKEENATTISEDNSTVENTINTDSNTIEDSSIKNNNQDNTKVCCGNNDICNDYEAIINILAHKLIDNLIESQYSYDGFSINHTTLILNYIQSKL